MKLRRSLIVFLLIFTMTIGVNAMGRFFNIKTQNGIKSVSEYMGITFKRNGKIHSGVIMDISGSKDRALFIVQYKDPESDSNEDELIDIVSDESEDIVIDAGL